MSINIFYIPFFLLLFTGLIFIFIIPFYKISISLKLIDELDLEIAEIEAEIRELDEEDRR